MALFLSSTYGLIIYKLCHVWTVNLWINSEVINIVRYKLCDVVKNVTYTFCDLSQINFITYKFCNYKLWKCKLCYWAAFICLQSATPYYVEGGLAPVQFSVHPLALSNIICPIRPKHSVCYHCGGWPVEVNACVLNSYMVYL